MKWISVKDRLPEDRETDVLWFWDDGKITMNPLWAASGWIGNRITHWMPLPSAPYHKKQMTNYEKIVSMSIDEMAEFICDNISCDCCPVSVFDAEFCECICPAPSGKEVEFLKKWLNEAADK